jgi:branched-chain amino acid transport system permease protein
MEKLTRNGTLTLGVIIVAALLVPSLLTSGFQLRLASIIWVYAILTMGFNLLYGFTGQISMGQQTFFAIGAYGFAMLQSKLGWSPFVAMPVAVLIAAAVACIIGLPILRLRTHYLAMATLAFSLMVVGLANRWVDFTGGTAGIQVPAIALGDATMTRSQLYYALVIVAALAFLIHNFIISGHLGRAMQAVRDDETAAASLGVNVTATKLRVFVLAAVFAAVAGIGYAMVNRQVNPSFGDFPVIVTILTIGVVGGLGTRFGPLVGAVIVVLAPQVLAQFGQLETLIYGVCLIVFMLFMPHGIAGILEKAMGRRNRQRATRDASPIAAPLAEKVTR